MTHLEEIEALVVGINRALAELRQARPLECREGAVQYRFDTLIGLLEIIANDAMEIKRQWESEEIINANIVKTNVPLV